MHMELKGFENKTAKILDFNRLRKLHPLKNLYIIIAMVLCQQDRVHLYITTAFELYNRVCLGDEFFRY